MEMHVGRAVDCSRFRNVEQLPLAAELGSLQRLRGLLESVGVPVVERLPRRRPPVSLEAEKLRHRAGLLQPPGGLALARRMQRSPRVRGAGDARRSRRPLAPFGRSSRRWPCADPRARGCRSRFPPASTAPSASLGGGSAACGRSASPHRQATGPFRLGRLASHLRLRQVAELAPILPRHREFGNNVEQGGLSDLAACAPGLFEAVTVGARRLRSASTPRSNYLLQILNSFSVATIGRMI